MIKTIAALAISLGTLSMSPKPVETKKAPELNTTLIPTKNTQQANVMVCELVGLIYYCHSFTTPVRG